MFKFEISIDGGPWEEIPELIFYDSLYRHSSRVTPLIKQMLHGQEIVYGPARYRITCMKKGGS